MKFSTILFAFVVLPFMGLSQNGDTLAVKKIDKPVRSVFESTWLIDNPTSVTNIKGTLEFDIQHRFGVIKSGKKDLLGIWAPSNIRLGFSYSISDRITLGFGTTKDNRLQDFNLKVGILRQTRSGKIPLSITYYGDMAIDARDAEYFTKSSDRYSYFNQLLISRKFSEALSLQVAPSFSHYNSIDSTLTSNNQFAVAIGGRIKISENTSILVDYSQPFGQNSNNPGLSLGIEMSTGSHAFQVFVGNYNGIVPQKNYMWNQNKLSDRQFLIGFNISRLWNF